MLQNVKNLQQQDHFQYCGRFVLSLHEKEFVVLSWSEPLVYVEVHYF